MRMVDLIEKTKRRASLTNDEIRWIVTGATDATIPDYQLAAWLMAVVLKGLTGDETSSLTEAMVQSGERLNLAAHGIHAVDKHSSGGVGDKTTLVLAPMLAAAGATVAKMSGRGLGFTGGTLDKLESIPGLRVERTTREFIEQARDIGLVIAGQSPTMAPADAKLYALRDVTGTVDSIPLIAASIMSKKIAAGASTLVLDVKCGGGAFLPGQHGAHVLATTMVDIGRHAGLQVAAIISSMDQPLGRAIGNALEVREAVETLKGAGPDDLLELSLELGAKLLKISGQAETGAEGKEKLRRTISDGTAFHCFSRMVAAQGGDASTIEGGDVRLPGASVQIPVIATMEGFVTNIAARELGVGSVLLGAGRAKKGDAIDHAAGFVLAARLGDAVRPGQTLATVHASTEDAARDGERAVRSAYRIGPERARAVPLIFEHLGDA